MHVGQIQHFWNFCRVLSPGNNQNREIFFADFCIVRVYLYMTFPTICKDPLYK